jgi:tetratricopeptide (TPR) repeat protein
MIEWFKDLSTTEKIACVGIAVTVILAIVKGLFELLKWLWPKKVRTTEKPPDPVILLPPDGIIHNLPYGSIGKLLKGRTNHMQRLQKQLSAAQTTAITQPAAIHGLGGVGKTRLAVEYAIDTINNKTYTAVFFVTADSVFSLNANLAALAGPPLLNLPEFNQPDQSLIVKAVIRALSHRDDCLLILDNVDDDAARRYIFQELLGQLTAPHILITSRLSDWPPDIEDLSVTELKTKEAASYLRARTQEKRGKTKNDNTSSEQLADSLAGLPVALEQAAAYINRMHITFDTYIQEFNDSRNKTLARYEDLVNYDSPVLFTWTSTQARLDPVAHGILRLAAFLAPDPIPTALFESQPDSLTPVTDLLKQEQFYQEIQPRDSELNIHDSLAELAGWSMINLAADSFIIHRIVQDSVRLTIPSDMQKQWVESALNLVKDYIPGEPPPNDVRSWPLWTILEPHVSCIIEQAMHLNNLKPTAWLMNELGLYFKQRVRFDEAEDIYKRSLASNEELLGPDHPTVASCLNNLALLYQATNRLKEAEPLMQRALAINEASFGKDHPNVAIRLNNLAALYKATNRLKEAEPLMQRALKIDEASLGSEHPNVAIRLNNLAALYKATNRLKDAEPLMQRALKIDEASLGSKHPNVARDLNNLAQLYQDTNRLKEAEPLMQRALEIWEKSFGKDHLQVANGLNNLALLYQATNRLKEAESLMQRALKIDEAALGSEHPTVAIDINNLAQLYQATNRLKEAEPLMQRSLAINEASFGKDHPNVAIRLNNLAALYQATNRLKEAEPLMKRALNIDEASFGKDHPDVAIRLNNLAALYQATNRLKEAEPLMARALKIDEAAFGKDHPNVARDLNNLALLYQATNRLKEAEPLMERVLAIVLQFTRRTGHPHPHLKTAINNYTALLIKMGHSEDQVAARLKHLIPEMSEKAGGQAEEE